jgi:hypothetical protein
MVLFIFQIFMKKVIHMPTTSHCLFVLRHSSSKFNDLVIIAYANIRTKFHLNYNLQRFKEMESGYNQDLDGKMCRMRNRTFTRC